MCKYAEEVTHRHSTRAFDRLDAVAGAFVIESFQLVTRSMTRRIATNVDFRCTLLNHSNRDAGENVTWKYSLLPRRRHPP